MNELEGWTCICADGPCSDFPCKTHARIDAEWSQRRAMVIAKLWWTAAITMIFVAAALYAC